MSEFSTENDQTPTCPHVTIPCSCFTCRTGRFADEQAERPCACGTDATSLDPAEVVDHQSDGCRIERVSSPATTSEEGSDA